MTFEGVLIETGGLFDLAKTMVSVLHKELEYKVEKLKNKKVQVKSQHFQIIEVLVNSINTSKILIPIRSGTHGHISTSSYELLSALWENKYFFYNISVIIITSSQGSNTNPNFQLVN